ncbi:unnamed protein product [Vitrella brassicaformis CCMP3155]|uniref:Dimethylglycine dehydrogenase n=2 Tax=Vitrella brassicaformis TaxID=1169539 RepID=A0A0G4GXB6_VITBC|nr:unnamed protein product [Vitrella brassicaformis CCMP3155]|mmetsp:Transcript_40074/g.100271  ORF Transcript_40074/g.100271 Transcript_40074/m.100271 type:complete len:888 (+) Transcript_40074:144-2807(+)|eukprot:CEM35624.1 unnamed protein product [Vitrella brassicaformis CCMP3155]
MQSVVIPFARQCQSSLVRTALPAASGGVSSLYSDRSCRAACTTRGFATDRKAPARQYSACIIGGGVVGASTLYHLGLAGVTDAVLFEKAELTAGSTWHAAGLVTYYHGGNNLRNWHKYGVQMAKKWQSEGTPLGFHETGSIRLLEAGDRMDETQYQMGKSKIWHQDQHLISPDEVRRLHPLCKLDGVVAGVYNPGDGHIDPSSFTNKFAEEARAMGGTIFKHAEVVDLDQLPNGQWDVTVNFLSGSGGDIVDKHVVKADFIINAGGLWADRVADMADVYHPLKHIQHQYLITESIPEVVEYQKTTGHQLPVLRDLVGSYYLRQERDGILIGPYESKESMCMAMDREWKEGPPKDFASELFPGDLDRLLPHIERATELVPVVETAGIKAIVNGPVSWPPDGNALLGPVPNKKNYYAACGFSYGIAHGPGAGKYLVDWILQGEPPYELFETDPTRYGDWTTPAFTDAKIRETYGFNNIIVYPNEERMAGRPLPERTTPIYERLKKQGAQFGFHSGWETPNWFDTQEGHNYEPSFRRTNWHEAVAREVQGINAYAGIADVSAFAKFVVEGRGAAAFLDKVLANRLPKEGRGNLSHMITPKGKIHSEVTCVRTGETSFYLISGSDAEGHDLRWLQTQADRLKCEKDLRIESVTDNMCVLAVVGPKSREVLQSVADHPEAFDAANFKFMQCKEDTLGGVPVRAIRVSFTGELGWELHHLKEHQAALYDLLKRDHPKLVDFGAYAQNSFRLEKGFKVFGKDMLRDHSPLQARMDPFIKFDKDFIGKDALLQKKSRGVGEMFVYLDVQGTDADRVDSVGNEPLYHNGELVGYTTSGGYGHTLGKSIAFGYSRVHQPNTTLKVALLGTEYDAVVREKPLADTQPMRERKKAQEPA